MEQNFFRACENNTSINVLHIFQLVAAMNQNFVFSLRIEKILKSQHGYTMNQNFITLTTSEETKSFNKSTQCFKTSFQPQIASLLYSNKVTNNIKKCIHIYLL